MLRIKVEEEKFRREVKTYTAPEYNLLSRVLSVFY